MYFKIWLCRSPHFDLGNSTLAARVSPITIRSMRCLVVSQNVSKDKNVRNSISPVSHIELKWVTSPFPLATQTFLVHSAAASATTSRRLTRPCLSSSPDECWQTRSCWYKHSAELRPISCFPWRRVSTENSRNSLSLSHPGQKKLKLIDGQIPPKTTADSLRFNVKCRIKQMLTPFIRRFTQLDRILLSRVTIFLTSTHELQEDIDIAQFDWDDWLWGHFMYQQTWYTSHWLGGTRYPHWLTHVIPKPIYKFKSWNKYKQEISPI